MSLIKLLRFLLFVPFVCAVNHVQAAELSNQSDSTIITYFKNIINDYRKADHESLPDSKKMALKDIEQSRKNVWALWIKANTDVAELPQPIKALADNKHIYPMNTWQLHGEDPMPFYYISKGEQPKTGYPMFINLHGSGPKKGEFEAALRWGLMYKDVPSVYFIPQIPNEKRYRWWFQPEQFAWEKLFRLAMLDGNVDANKIYVMGISEGGYGSQRLGAFYADYLAGAGPMAGGEPLKNAPPLNFRNIAFSFQTGENDGGFGRNTNTARAKKVFDSLQVLHPDDFKHNIVLQPKKGHGIDYKPTTPWLIQYKRNPQPANISWVYFPMDGRYRNGFYNVAINKQLNISDTANIDRAIFNLNIDKKKNTIDLEVWLADGDLTQKEEVKQGEISIFLSPELVDLSKKVKLFYKGKLIFNKKVQSDENVLVESCALFGDPERLFPAKIKVVL